VYDLWILDVKNGTSNGAGVPQLPPDSWGAGQSGMLGMGAIRGIVVAVVDRFGCFASAEWNGNGNEWWW